ncbi:homoserine O-acetyltransferase [Malassezia cuniculi]|uniref:Homoserine O-acetyltransferase n=1 Tax=Malassezia cuniculi TaxID=948313 RepID=A0AAF0ESI9_9BASI|nr:homoserine O-acetyltransferase [Malassezia cuniculi]
MPSPVEIAGPTSPFCTNIKQRYLVVPSFTFESGETLENVPVSFNTYGSLNAGRDNCVMVCHPISGSPDVVSWWEPLVGPGRLFDTARFFIVCCNAIGSPYGTASPVTRRGGELFENGKWVQSAHVTSPNEQTSVTWWGSDFPRSTVRDDVRLHKHVLEYLGVEQIAIAVGGSMGGMSALEWPLCFPVRYPKSDDHLLHVSPAEKPYVRTIMSLASSARHTAWCIAWSDVQRLSITTDPNYSDGQYLLSKPPTKGLESARMAAMLTYRHAHSIERRFRRMRGKDNISRKTAASQPSASTKAAPQQSVTKDKDVYAVQSYLRHHGAKFVARFDANCYVHLTHKLDSQDVTRGRESWAHAGASEDDVIRAVLNKLGTTPVSPLVLIISVTSDILYPPSDQRLIHDHIPGSDLVDIQSSEGHDGFLLEYPQIERAMRRFLTRAEGRKSLI